MGYEMFILVHTISSLHISKRFKTIKKQDISTYCLVKYLHEKNILCENNLK